MNLIEGWFQAPAESGHGVFQIFLLAAVGIVIVVVARLVRPYFLRWLEWHVRELGKREEGDGRFDT